MTYRRGKRAGLWRDLLSLRDQRIDKFVGLGFAAQFHATARP